MKIEFTCPECKTLMRLAVENAGKQARCPVCSTISQIPLGSQPVKPRAAKPISREPDFDEPNPQPRNNKRSRKDSPPENSSQSSQAGTFIGLDREIIYGIGLGMASLGSNFVCCGVYVGLPASIVGLLYTFLSKSVLKQSSLVINGMGFVLNAAILGWRLL